MRAAAVVITLALAACGVDGPPKAPGMTVTGTVQMGIAKDGG